MSDRPLILLGVQGSKHLVVPAVRGCDGVGAAQCAITSDNMNLTPIDFTNTYNTTDILGTDGSGGRGDMPVNVNDESLDLFTTSCSMGDHSKRGLIPDDHGNFYGQFETAAEPTVCSTQGWCGRGWGWEGGDNCNYEYSAPCNARIFKNNNCEIVKYDEPDGYMYVSNQICFLDDIASYTSLGDNVLSTLGFSEDMKACSYNYRKNWDDPFWETPGEIYELSYSSQPEEPEIPTGNDGTPLYNSNGIPIKRMECCIGHAITEGVVDMTSPFDYNECPVDTTRYTFGNHGTSTASTQNLSVVGQSNDDAIRAYVPESLMCDGRSSRHGGIDDTKTPQHWCTYNMQDNFNISKFSDYWNMLNDEHCINWLELDESKPPNEHNREISYSNKLKDFYKWIAHDLANVYELKPIVGTNLLPMDYSLELTGDNRTDFNESTTGYVFDASNDYGKYINLLKARGFAPLKYFINHSHKDDRDEFNNNMEIFCNRPDIFNFKDWSDDRFKQYNERLEEKYSDICNCYWNKDIDFTPSNQFDKIRRTLYDLSQDSVSTETYSTAVSYMDNLNINLKNQCWFNRCIDNINGITNPYITVSDAAMLGVASDIPDCPSICQSLSTAQSIINAQNTIFQNSDLTLSAVAESDMSCDSDSPYTPTGSIPPISELIGLNELVNENQNTNPSEESDFSDDTNPDTNNNQLSNKTNAIIIILSFFVILLLLFSGYQVLFAK
jgi:hypothetical protein